MTDQEQDYIDRGECVPDDFGPSQPENQGYVPTLFAGADADPDQDQTMSALDEALQAATDGDELTAVDAPYDGESDAPGQPS